MTLLEELKQQAELQLKDSQDLVLADRQVDYQQRLKPRMHAILKYLSELTGQLKVVDPNVRHDFDLPGIGTVTGLRQGGYVVNADSADQTKIIRLRFHCQADDEKTYAIKPKSLAEETGHFLESQNMRYAEWPIRDNGQQIIGCKFQTRLKVNIQFIFQVDVEQCVIEMISTNFNGFGVDKLIVKPERINDQWLDDLGNFILRRNQNLQHLEIAESEKNLIRQRLEMDNRARQQERELAMYGRFGFGMQRRNSLFGKFIKSR